MNDAAYTMRSQPVRPTMIRMNPTLPTATFTVWPIRRIRRAVVPLWNCAPNTFRTGPGATARSSNSGIVPATTHRVSALYRLSSWSRSPR